MYIYTGLISVFKHFGFLDISSIDAAETDLVEKLFVCNEGLFWFGESCLTYIIFKLHSCINLRRRAKKQRKKNTFTMLAHFPNTAPSTTSASLLSLQLTLCLSDLLSLFHPLLPHTSHLSLLHSERPIWGSVRSVRVTVWAPVHEWEELPYISVSLTPVSIDTWLEVRQIWASSSELHLEEWALYNSLRNLRRAFFLIIYWSLYAFIW